MAVGGRDGRGSPRPSRWSSAVRPSSEARSTLLATTTTGPGNGAGCRRPRRRRGGGPRVRRAPARQRRRRRSPPRLAWTARESESPASRSTPPGVDQAELAPFHSQSSALRSRVTPGLARGPPPPFRRRAGSRGWTCRRWGSRPPRSRAPRAHGEAAARAASRRRGRRRRRPCGRSCRPRRASAAARRAPCSRSRSRSSRSAWARHDPACARPFGRATAGARSSGAGGEEDLKAASGLTTVPMSRPSAT